MASLLAEMLSPAFWLAAGQIIGINIVLSGDNAVVIALACRMLPAKERFWGMILGAGVAVLLRIVFTLVVAQAMGYPFLKLIGGVLLLWVAVKLVVPEEDHGEGKVAAADNLWRAVRIVAIADIVMSLDNVIAIAAAAETAGIRVDPLNAEQIKAALIVFGLVTSIPLIVAGSALLMSLLDRFPVLVWAGAALLGWVAGDIMVKDAALAFVLTASDIQTLHYFAAVGGAAFVVGMGYWLRQYQQKKLLQAPLVIDPPGPEEFPHRR